MDEDLSCADESFDHDASLVMEIAVPSGIRTQLAGFADRAIPDGKGPKLESPGELRRPSDGEGVGDDRAECARAQALHEHESPAVIGRHASRGCHGVVAVGHRDRDHDVGSTNDRCEGRGSRARRVSVVMLDDRADRGTGALPLERRSRQPAHDRDTWRCARVASIRSRHGGHSSKISVITDKMSIIKDSLS
jgi:hypothetical protein